MKPTLRNVVHFFDDDVNRTFCRLAHDAGITADYITQRVSVVRVVIARRGRFHWTNLSLTVPWWAWVGAEGSLAHGKPGYGEYYLAHEMAHAMTSRADAHGPAFQEWLKRLAPDLCKYEHDYKPQRAAAAGIPNYR